MTVLANRLFGGQGTVAGSAAGTPKSTELMGPPEPELAGPPEPGFLSKVSGLFGDANKFLGSDKGQIMMQSLSDLQKRNALQPVLETEALFKAFGRPSNLSASAEKGALGADIIGDLAEGKFLSQKRKDKLSDRELETKKKEAVIKAIEKGTYSGS